MCWKFFSHDQKTTTTNTTRQSMPLPPATCVYISLSLCVCVHVCLFIFLISSCALFASFVVSHFQVFPYQSMHRLLIISRRHSCKIFVRISSQVQSMRIGSTKCGAHIHTYSRVCVCFLLFQNHCLIAVIWNSIEKYTTIFCAFSNFPFSISILFSLTSQAVESIEQYSHSEYVEEHTTKVVKQTTTQVSMVKKGGIIKQETICIKNYT